MAAALMNTGRDLLSYYSLNKTAITAIHRIIRLYYVQKCRYGLKNTGATKVL